MEKKKYCYEYPRPALTSDIAVLRLEGLPEILLVERKDPPFEGMWALPGGFMEIEENLEEAARRELLEETGLKAGELIRFETYDRPDRDPRGRTITQVFIMIWKADMGTAVAGSDASAVKWFDLTQLPALAFDHAEILNDVIEMMREGAK
ncbi:MAG: NUDIX hydrolase [Bacteroides sp.]|nr:NUDIX hydrolase [Bacteroides sp.]